MKYTMIKFEYGQPKELESFEAHNHQEARKKVLNSAFKNECMFLRSITKENKTKSFSMTTVYGEW